MRKCILISASIFLCVLLAGANPAWSLTVGSIDVGEVDTWLASTRLGNSGEDTELQWVRSVLGSDIVLQERTETEEGAGWLRTNEDSRVYAFDFVGDNTEYFLVKTGATSSGNTHFLFENVQNFSWGVIDLDLNDIESIKNVGKLSHIGEYGAGAPVPEPATLVLLGSGLLGLAGFRRKAK